MFWRASACLTPAFASMRARSSQATAMSGESEQVPGIVWSVGI
jgi:hypothetical protein